MNFFGRNSVCGAISGYNDQEFLEPAPQKFLVFLQLKMEGFMVSRWAHRWMEGINQMTEWIRSGKIKYHETITRGFETCQKLSSKCCVEKNTGKVKA